jgi:hypothetical protein
MRILRGEEHQNETIVMDDLHLIDCKFIQCLLVYSGGECSWQNTIFVMCQLNFIGPALHTIHYLQGFGWTPPPGGELKPAVALPPVPPVPSSGRLQ